MKTGVPTVTWLKSHSASHGCIRMLIPDATWLFDHVSIGTPVLIVG